MCEAQSVCGSMLMLGGLGYAPMENRSTEIKVGELDSYNNLCTLVSKIKGILTEEWSLFRAS